jgi:hypothetical protein
MSEERGASETRSGRSPGMSLNFSVGKFRDMTRREFYRIALRAVLETGRCLPEHEERLIEQLRREENTVR